MTDSILLFIIIGSITCVGIISYLDRILYKRFKKLEEKN